MRYTVLAKVGPCEWRPAWETNDLNEARHVRTIVLATGEIKQAKIVDCLNIPWYTRIYNFALSLIL